MGRRRKKKGQQVGKTGSIEVADVILFLIISAFVLGGAFILWWAEDQDARYGRLYNETENAVVEISDLSIINSELDGKIVHLTGNPEIPLELHDTQLDIITKALVYHRKVEYYQVIEHEMKNKKENGHYETVYDYSKTWTDHAVNPSSFKGHGSDYYKRQAELPICTLKSLDLVAQDVTIGAYKLPEFLLGSMHYSEPFKPSLSPEQKEAIVKKLNIKSDLLHETNEGIYIGEDPKSANVGDVRIKLSIVPVTELSLIAKLTGDTFDRYRMDEDPENVNLAEIMPGNISTNDMFKEMKSNITGGALLIGFLGGIIIFVAFFFLPWNGMINRLSFARLIVNGDTHDHSEWELLPVARLAIVFILIVSAVVWIPATPSLGITLAVIALGLTFLPVLKRCLKKE